MRKRLFFSLVSIAIMMILSSCQSGSHEKENSVYNIYYVNEDETDLVKEEYVLSADTGDLVAVIDELLQKLWTGGERSRYTPPIESGLEVTDFQIKETQLSVFFSAAYNNRSGIREILCRAAIVKTLCQIQEVDYVEFYVEDQPLMLSGNAVGLMNANYFVDDLKPDFTENKKQVTLYYPDETGQRMDSVITEVSYNSAEPIAHLLLEKLIAGPSSLEGLYNTKLISALPSGTQVNSVTIRDNICYVDMNKSFTVQKKDVKSEVVIYSVVNTLCELSNINKVQFSVEGKQLNYYGDVKDFNLPLERNLDLVSGMAEYVY